MVSTGRKKAEYRQSALIALEITVRAFVDQDHFSAVGPPLIAALQQHEVLSIEVRALQVVLDTVCMQYSARDAHHAFCLPPTAYCLAALPKLEAWYGAVT